MEKQIDSEMDLIESIFYSWSLRSDPPDRDEMQACECFFKTEEGLDEYRRRVAASKFSQDG